MQGNFKEYYYNGILKSEGKIIFGKKTGGIKEYNIGGIFMKVNIQIIKKMEKEKNIIIMEN